MFWMIFAFLVILAMLKREEHFNPYQNPYTSIKAEDAIVPRNDYAEVSGFTSTLWPSNPYNKAMACVI